VPTRPGGGTKFLWFAFASESAHATGEHNPEGLGDFSIRVARADTPMGCTEGPPEDAELTAVTDAIAAYAGLTAKLKVAAVTRKQWPECLKRLPCTFAAWPSQCWHELSLRP